MAEDKKQSPVPEAHTTPEAPAPKTPGGPAVEEQAIDRVHRIGQQKRVFVYRMVSAGTVEERIEKLKQQKRELFNALVGGIPDMSDWAQHFPSLESLIELSE